VREARDFGSDVIHWKARYSGLSVLDLKRLKKLDAENAKLKKMYAELAIENEAIKAVLN